MDKQTAQLNGPEATAVVGRPVEYSIQVDVVEGNEDNVAISRARAEVVVQLKKSVTDLLANHISISTESSTKPKGDLNIVSYVIKASVVAPTDAELSRLHNNHMTSRMKQEASSKPTIYMPNIFPKTDIKATIRKKAMGIHAPFYTEEGETIIMTMTAWEDTKGESFTKPEEDYRNYPKVYVLVDGDLVAYKSASVTDGRHYKVVGSALKFKYKKEAVAFCDKKSIPNSDILLAFDPEPEANALNNIDVSINETISYYRYERKLNPIIKILMTGDKNWRKEFYPDYKKSRRDVRKPAHLALCKDHLINSHKAFKFEPFEADDIIAMTVHSLKAKLKERIDKGEIVCAIASNDKDFTQCGGPGIEQYDLGKQHWSVTDEEAVKYFYKQILTGDSSDDVPGIAGTGPQTAIKILADCSTPYEMYQACVKAYIAAGSKKKEAMDHIKKVGTLLWLKRTEDDEWVPPTE